jgi:hydrogenase-4 component E
MLDTLLFALLLLNLVLLASSRLSMGVRCVALQGALIGLVPVLAHHEYSLSVPLVMALLTVTVKGVALPLLLFRALRELGAHKEAEPSVGPTLSVAAGLLCFLFAHWLSGRLPLPLTPPSRLIVPVSFATMFAGFFILTARSMAITQVLGYLVLENGIFLFGAGLLPGQPVLVELGVLLDVFVAVFVMGIILFHIKREFEGVDTGEMEELTDYPQQTGKKGISE